MAYTDQPATVVMVLEVRGQGDGFGEVAGQFGTVQHLGEPVAGRGLAEGLGRAPFAQEHGHGGEPAVAVADRQLPVLEPEFGEVAQRGLVLAP